MATIQDRRAQITARIWQGIAQSGVDLTPVPRERTQALVDTLADGMLLEFNDLLDDLNLPGRPQLAAASQADRPEEGVLWQGRPLLSLTEQYVVTTQRVRVISGLLGKDREDIELVRIQDLDHKQDLGERVLNIGDIFIRSADPTNPEVVLRNVNHPEQVHEIIRRAMLAARDRYRLQFREEM